MFYKSFLCQLNVHIRSTCTTCSCVHQLLVFFCTFVCDELQLQLLLEVALRLLPAVETLLFPLLALLLPELPLYVCLHHHDVFWQNSIDFEHLPNSFKVLKKHRIDSVYYYLLILIPIPIDLQICFRVSNLSNATELSFHLLSFYLL